MLNSFYLFYYKVNAKLKGIKCKANLRAPLSSIDYHNPEMENLVCSFQRYLGKNYLDHDDFYYY
jgi:hypothetical protein